MVAGRQLNDALSWAAVFMHEVRLWGLLVSKSSGCLSLLPILRNRGIWSSGLSLRAVQPPPCLGWSLSMTHDYNARVRCLCLGQCLQCSHKWASEVGSGSVVLPSEYTYGLLWESFVLKIMGHSGQWCPHLWNLASVSDITEASSEGIHRCPSWLSAPTQESQGLDGESRKPVQDFGI